jgi:hypothetical protein
MSPNSARAGLRGGRAQTSTCAALGLLGNYGSTIEQASCLRIQQIVRVP